jgi:hypothetical protein
MSLETPVAGDPHIDEVSRGLGLGRRRPRQRRGLHDGPTTRRSNHAACRAWSRSAPPEHTFAFPAPRSTIGELSALIARETTAQLSTVAYLNRANDPGPTGHDLLAVHKAWFAVTRP